jgi:hypothetical protein
LLPLFVFTELLPGNAFIKSVTILSKQYEHSRILRFFYFSHGVRLSPLGTAATIGLLYQHQMIDDDDDCGAIGGMKIGRGNRSTRRKPTPVPL